MERNISKNISKIKENLEGSKEQLISVMADVARLTSDNPEFGVVYTALKTLGEALTLTEKSVAGLETSVKNAHSTLVKLNDCLGS